MKFRKLLVVYVFLLACVLVAMFQLWTYIKASSAPRDYAEIQNEGVLRMVTEYNPLGYYVSDDTISGFQYELSRAIAAVSGLEVQVHLEMSLTKSFEELRDKQCDVIARNIPITSEIREDYLFTEPIILNKQVLVQRTAEANNDIPPIRNQLDLAQKTLYIPKGSPALLRLKNLSHEIGDTIYVEEDALYSGEQLSIMVAKGDIDYAVCDRQTARIAKENLPEIDIDTDISFTQLQSWTLRKDSPVLLDSLNSWLKRIKDSGLYDQIYKRYYGKK